VHKRFHRIYLKTKVKVTFPILLDTRGMIKKLYRTTGIPETFIVDKRGILVKKVIGAIDWSKPEVVEFFRTLIRAGMQGDRAFVVFSSMAELQRHAFQGCKEERS